MVAKKANTRVTTKKPDSGVPDGPTSALQWKKTSSGGTPIRVPSGNVALVKRAGLQVFLAQGIIPNSLMEFVTKSLKGNYKPKVEDLDLSPDTMRDMMSLVDAVTVQSCIEPRVWPIPQDVKGNGMQSEYRDQDKLYVDEVDVEDKMFIFNYAVGGTADVESFRKEFAAVVDDV